MCQRKPVSSREQHPGLTSLETRRKVQFHPSCQMQRRMQARSLEQHPLTSSLSICLIRTSRWLHSIPSHHRHHAQSLNLFQVVCSMELPSRYHSPSTRTQLSECEPRVLSLWMSFWTNLAR